MNRGYLNDDYLESVDRLLKTVPATDPLKSIIVELMLDIRMYQTELSRKRKSLNFCEKEWIEE